MSSVVQNVNQINSKMKHEIDMVILLYYLEQMIISGQIQQDMRIERYNGIVNVIVETIL